MIIKKLFDNNNNNNLYLTILRVLFSVVSWLREQLVLQVTRYLDTTVNKPRIIIFCIVLQLMKDQYMICVSSLHK